MSRSRRLDQFSRINMATTRCRLVYHDRWVRLRLGLQLGNICRFCQCYRLQWRRCVLCLRRRQMVQGLSQNQILHPCAETCLMLLVDLAPARIAESRFRMCQSFPPGMQFAGQCDLSCNVDDCSSVSKNGTVNWTGLPSPSGYTYTTKQQIQQFGA